MEEIYGDSNYRARYEKRVDDTVLYRLLRYTQPPQPLRHPDHGLIHRGSHGAQY